MHPTARSAANIGLGSGMTTHVLLSVPGIDAVDTIEIERAMIEGAEAFRPRNERAYTDPRSRIVVDDAKTFFSTERRRYDIIVSEPSNPWVSGTASLFSAEFYQLVQQYLNADGLFVQWLQLYEFDMDLVASVLKAMGPHFADYAIYEPTSGDVLIVATNRERVPAPRADVFAAPELAGALSRVGVRSLQDVQARRIANKTLLEPWLRTTSIRANSDFRPVLYHRAARARFLNRDAGLLTTMARGPLPVVALLGGESVASRSTDITVDEFFSPAYEASIAIAVRNLLLNGETHAGLTAVAAENANAPDRIARQLVEQCTASRSVDDRSAALYALGWRVAGRLRPVDLSAVWSAIEALPCASNLSSLDRDWMALFRAVGSREPREMASAAERLLMGDGPGPAQRAFAVAAGMLGHLASGAPDAARALWQTSQPLDTPELSFVLAVLTAHAGQ